MAENLIMASIDKVRLEDLEEIEKVLLELSPTNETKPREKEEALDRTVDMEEEEEEDNEEIVILECNIYKYHGADQVSSLDRQVSEGILKFQYRDEDDEDIIEVNVVEKGDKGIANSSLDLITIEDEDNDPEDEDEDHITDEEQVLTCEECGMDVIENQLEDHKIEKHKITTKRQFKTFYDGNFFMLAD